MYKKSRDCSPLDVGDPLLSGLEVEGVLDGSFEEADHVVGQLLWVVKEDVVAAVLELEHLRLTSLVVAVVLHDRV